MKFNNFFNNGDNVVNMQAVGKCIINGKSYSGKSITMINGKVFVDGKGVDVDRVDISSANNILIKGKVNKVNTTSGSIECGDVTGDVRTVSGSVDCGNVSGDIDTVSGSVRYKR